MLRKIVVSAVNLRNGGPLSILNDCLSYLDKNLVKEFDIYALVHNNKVIAPVSGITLIEFPNSIDSYFTRLYYEFVTFKRLSKRLKPYLWLSLHDVTPVVKAEVRAVYCHNASPFYQPALKEYLLDPRFVLFCLFYKYLYSINICKNDYVIVQQEWMRDKFRKLFGLEKIVVSYPSIESSFFTDSVPKIMKSKFLFFYPSFPRTFKNFEVICEAVQALAKECGDRFEVVLTIGGNENRYSKYLYKRYCCHQQIKFVGLLTRDKVFEYYARANCLIFPSKLETWGLPITEFKKFNKPMLLADLPYSHETVANYDMVNFFDPDNSGELASQMKRLIDGNFSFEANRMIKPAAPFASDWSKLFEILLINSDEMKN